MIRFIILVGDAKCLERDPLIVVCQVVRQKVFLPLLETALNANVFAKQEHRLWNFVLIWKICLRHCYFSDLKLGEAEQACDSLRHHEHLTLLVQELKLFQTRAEGEARDLVDKIPLKSDRVTQHDLIFILKESHLVAVALPLISLSMLSICEAVI